jgi:GLPGLI family protein
MKKIINLLAAVLLSAQFISAQGLRVVYEETFIPLKQDINYDSITNNPEAKALFAGQQSIGFKSIGELYINKDKGISLYSSTVDAVKNPQKEKIPITGGTFVSNIKSVFSSNKSLLYKDIINNKTVSQTEFEGKNYITTKDTLIQFNWKIEDERKVIAGYECIRAKSDMKVDDHIQETVAWFAPDIPTDNGPSLCWGLPGLILGVEINVGTNRALESNCISIETIENVDEIRKPDGEEIESHKLSELIHERMNKDLEKLKNYQPQRSGNADMVSQKRISSTVMRKIIY